MENILVKSHNTFDIVKRVDSKYNVYELMNIHLKNEPDTVPHDQWVLTHVTETEDEAKLFVDKRKLKR